MDWSLAVEILMIIVGVISSYFVLENKTKINTMKLVELENTVNEHVKETPLCQKKFSEIGIELLNMKNDQINKSNTLQTIVNQIVTPSIDKMGDEIKNFVDIKLKFVDKEIEMMKIENDRRFLEIQKSQNNFEKMACELIEVSNKNVENQINRLVELFKNKI